jgi:integrase
MPYRRKDSPAWWVSYTDASGKRIRRPAGTTNRAEAAALEAKWRLETYRVRQWDDKPARTFDELMLNYLQATRDKRSADKDRMRTKHLRCVFGGREMHALLSADVRSYIETRRRQGRSNATINRELALLSAAINYANREWDWALPNPARGRKLREPEGRVRWITRAEAQGLIEAAGQLKKAVYLADFIRLALHTGCRSQEMLGLEWRRVDLQTGLFHLEGTHTKTGKRRSVPLNQIAREAIMARLRFRAQHCPDSPWVFAHPDGSRLMSVRKAFAIACRRAGISGYRIHDMRHTCAAWLVTAGVAMPEIRDLLGHSNLTMTEKYAHLAPENVRAAVDRLAGIDQEMDRSRFGHVTHFEGQRKHG